MYFQILKKVNYLICMVACGRSHINQQPTDWMLKLLQPCWFVSANVI